MMWWFLAGLSALLAYIGWRLSPPIVEITVGYDDTLSKAYGERVKVQLYRE